MTTRPAAIKEFSDAVLRLKWAVQDARLSVAERRELDDSIMDLEVAHAERLRVALEPDPVQPQPPSYQALVAAVAELHQHALTVVGNGQLVKLVSAAHMAALEYAVATRWAPPTDKWSAAARAVMDRTTPAEGTPVVAVDAPQRRRQPFVPQRGPLPCGCREGAHANHHNYLQNDAERAGRVCLLGWPAPVNASGLVALDLSDCEDVP